MALLDQLQIDIVTAMKQKDEVRLNTLRAIKTALDRFRTDQQKPITEDVEQSILATLSKQRREAADAFLKGQRLLLAAKEETELLMIQAYMPKEASEEQIDAAVAAAMYALQNASTNPVTIKSMGVIMKDVTARLAGFRADGKIVSDKVKAALS